MPGDDPFTVARRLVELAEGPLEQLRRQQERIDRILAHSSPAIEKFLLEQERIESLFKSAEESTALLTRWHDNTPYSFIERELERSNSASSLFQTVEAALARDAAVSARIFEQNSLAQFAEDMSRQFEPFRHEFERQQLWAERLEIQMRAISVQWVRPEIAALSLEGFAVVSRLNTAVRYEPPFDDEASDVIDEDLGDPIIIDDGAAPEARDAAHIEAGMHPGMLAFAPAAFGEVLIQTGFTLKSGYAPLPATTDGSDPGLVFHPGHNALITAVEVRLRHLISQKLSAQYGSDWIDKRVDPNLVADWKFRRDEAVAKGEPPLELLHYSYLMDLKDIIVRRDHWRDVFKDIFGSKEHFSVSMERLHPIRHPLSHGRPIGTGQQFHLISEAGRILGAMGYKIFET